MGRPTPLPYYGEKQIPADQRRIRNMLILCSQGTACRKLPVETQARLHTYYVVEEKSMMISNASDQIGSLWPIDNSDLEFIFTSTRIFQVGQRVWQTDMRQSSSLSLHVQAGRS